MHLQPNFDQNPSKTVSKRTGATGAVIAFPHMRVHTVAYVSIHESRMSFLQPQDPEPENAISRNFQLRRQWLRHKNATRRFKKHLVNASQGTIWRDDDWKYMQSER